MSTSLQSTLVVFLFINAISSTCIVENCIICQTGEDNQHSCQQCNWGYELKRQVGYDNCSKDINLRLITICIFIVIGFLIFAVLWIVICRINKENRLLLDRITLHEKDRAPVPTERSISHRHIQDLTNISREFDPKRLIHESPIFKDLKIVVADTQPIKNEAIKHAEPIIKTEITDENIIELNPENRRHDALNRRILKRRWSEPIIIQSDPKWLHGPFPHQQGLSSIPIDIIEEEGVSESVKYTQIHKPSMKPDNLIK